MRPDFRTVLVHSVVVGDDRAGADVGPLTNFGVTDIRQMRNLRTGTDLGILRFDEGAYLALIADHGPRSEVCERADGAARAEDGP